jgi:RES domain-containing protein
MRAKGAAAPVTVWRIAKHTKDYRAEDLSGGGAASVGGRWNDTGHAVVYAGTTIALSTLETLAHIGDDIACRNRFLVAIEIPHKLWQARQVLQVKDLPLTWVSEPPGMDTMRIGNDWLTKCEALLLMVPSVIVPEEFNVLINPRHKDAYKLTAKVVRPYLYDPRFS